MHWILIISLKAGPPKQFMGSFSPSASSIAIKDRWKETLKFNKDNKDAMRLVGRRIVIIIIMIIQPINNKNHSID